MKQITSFTINHDYLQRGMYISRIDGDVITYDIRMKIPNNPEGEYLDDNGLHTFEHLFATYVRNTSHSEEILYVGPMGCRTGFYFLTRDSLSGRDAIRLVQESLRFILDFAGEIPGTKRWECGNYQAHDLKNAKEIAGEMLPVLANWTEAQLHYPNEVAAQE
jgi:S-ribosylhomocysteine lyase